jgi:NHS family xanthosine MFS transporter
MVDCWELWFGTKGWSGAEFGRYFSTLGIASIMPALTGIIADRWITEKLYGILHILSGFAIFYIPQVDDLLFSIGLIFFGYDVFYMPTISLSNSVA